MRHQIATILDPNKVWKENIESQLTTVKHLYNLPIITNEEKISKSFFQYCLKGKYFVVIVIYNGKREFFIQRNFLKRSQEWELVGGWINYNENFEQALDRIVKKETGSILVESTPIAITNNKYSTETGNSITHTGLAYLGRILNDKSEIQDGVFTNDCKNIINKRDLKILTIAQNILKIKLVEPPIEEIEHHFTNNIANYINRFFVKPLSFNFSSRILSKAISNVIDGGKNSDTKTVLDMACGDDKSILKLSEKVKLLVANDISRQSMRKLISSTNNNKIIFTNHNLLELEFNITFDVVICKNVMHHMRNAEELEMMLEVLKKLGKQIIIMDIQNPRISFLSRMWNNYYVNILEDHGGLFITYIQFRSIINTFFEGNKKIKMETIPTIKGKYMLAVINQ